MRTRNHTHSYVAASVLFQMPVLRELCLWSACIDASRKVAKKALDMGYSLFVYPGKGIDIHGWQLLLMFDVPL